MGLSLERIRIKVVVENRCSVVFVVNIIVRRIFHIYQGGRPQIYSAQEAQIVGDVGYSIPQIFTALYNRHVNHHASIIEMEGKLCD